MNAQSDGDSKAPTSSVKQSLKAAGRGALWPARRFIDPRIQGMLSHVDARYDELQARLMSLQDLHAANADAEVEAATVVMRSLDDILRETERITLLLQQPPAKRFIEDLDELDGDVANFLNYALGNTGFSAQAGLWFNPPVLVSHREGSVEVEHVSERIAEVPYVFRALSALERRRQHPRRRRSREHRCAVARLSRVRGDGDRSAAVPFFAPSPALSAGPDRGLGHE